VTDPTKFLEDVTGRYARVYYRAVHDLYVAHVTGDRVLAHDARGRLAETMAQTMGVAEVVGASLMLRATARVARVHGGYSKLCRGMTSVPMLRFADEPTQTVLPRVTFAEALEDLVTRTPATLRVAAERTAQRIAQLYSADRVMAFARSAEESVTRAAQQFIATAFREGTPEGEAGRRLAMAVEDVRAESAPWSRSYSRMVFRTNVNAAVTAGRFRQARDPDVRGVFPAFRYDAVMDADTRPNHAAANNHVWSTSNPAWDRLAPPLGYNCRCQVVAVSVFELEDEGKVDEHGRVRDDPVPQGAHPDEGFRHEGRPDLRMVGT
jgi:SPP1 gp7 family putative phage head morphogenesis protein